jgi:acylphosphatase
MKKHMNIRISGKVQNVGFRYSAQQAAEEHQVTGYVHNEPDGSVYIEAEGEEDALERFVSWCHQGPSWARVAHVDTSESGVVHFRDFAIR